MSEEIKKLAPQPEDADQEISLPDLIPVEYLQEFQDSFARACNVAAIISHADGRPITTSSNPCRLCQLIWKTEKGLAKCLNSDRQLCEKAGQVQKPIHELCHSCGLADASAPIIVAGRHIANWLIGQRVIQEVSESHLRKFAEETGIPPAEILDAYANVPRISAKQFEAVLDLLWNVTRELSTLAYDKLLLAQNVAEQEQHMTQLRDSEKNLSHAQKIAHLGSWVEDLSTKALTWSDEVFRIFGILPEHFGNNRDAFMALVHADDREKVRKAVDGAITKKGGFEIEHRIVRPGGETRFVHERGEIVFGGQEKPVQLIGTVQDITARRFLEEQQRELHMQLARAKRMESLGVLASGVAHDLNNILSPLVIVPGMIKDALGSICEKCAGEAHNIREDLTGMEESAKRASVLIRDLLTMSRRELIEMYPLPLNDVIREYLDSYEFEEVKKDHPGVVLSASTDPDLPSIQGSAPHLYRVLDNLLRNACDAMPEGGTLYVETKSVTLTQQMMGHEVIPPGQYVVLKVKDSGQGIAKKDMDRIFEPFFTSKKRRRGSKSGSGLGLAVVYGVAKDHGGFINLISQPEQGALFELYFPVAQPEDESSSPRQKKKK